MQDIFLCPKCGVIHLAEKWWETTADICGIQLDSYTIYYCPSCGEANTLEAINLGF